MVEKYKFMHVWFVGLLFIAACAGAESERIELDTDNNGVTDLIQMYEGGNLISAKVNEVNGSRSYEHFFWGRNGDLLRIERNPAVSILTDYYLPGSNVQLGGRVLRKQKLDRQKTYQEHADPQWLAEYKGITTVYSHNKSIVARTLDSDGDGISNTFVLFDDYNRPRMVLIDTDKDGTFDEKTLYAAGVEESVTNCTIPADIPLDELLNM